MKMNYQKVTEKRILQISMIILSLIFLLNCGHVTNESEFNDESSALLEADIPDIQDMDVSKLVDVMPEPEEGLAAFLNYIGDHIKYPEEAKEQGIEGKVFVRFVVTKNGDISHVQVIKGMGYGMDDEAVRVVSSYDKKWKPGMNKGKLVNTEMVLPINYAF